MIKHIYILLLILFYNSIAFCQDKKTTFGFQVKPIIPINYFNAGLQSLQDTAVSLNISPKMGFSFGVLIRQEISKSISIETGISSVRRNYDIKAKEIKGDSTDKSDFGFVSYQIPIQGLVYIQLSENIFMNTTAGIGLDMYPSSVKSLGENYRLSSITYRRHWLSYSLLANIGFEYRTSKNGVFYIGTSFNRPFKPIALSNFYYYYKSGKRSEINNFLNGNYITIDIRFFFPENNSK